MRIAVVGAGAVGGALAGYLAATGRHDVSLLARGAHLAAIRERGLTVRTPTGTLSSRPQASDDASDLGHQDMVIVTVKGHGLPALAPSFPALCGPETLVVAAQNGVPWWYLYGAGDDVTPEPLEVVDPGGAVWSAIGPERVAACVMEVLPARIVEPGIVAHTATPVLALGAPRPGDHAEKLAALAKSFNAAGATARLPADIRVPLWSKLMLNMAVGPTSVLTGATMGAMEQAPGMAAVQGRLMRECLAVARAWGVDLPDDVDERLGRGSGVPGHKPSMLQDFEAGRSMEIDPIVTAVLELARRRGMPVPTIETLWALTALKERAARAG
ncbi:2-dehydropantoate 2-reductase [Azospirillum palustre]|uniref:2-dehydropantoate 2-reductase n=1 Tax=Azospirillum palustre TaxID=2044885 RepID=A0A2B8BN05_9PROT|nr:2-dehydropantoate 2-reductase [Azospirillum palustre]PGH58792.1 2-dehydropantoate 2-reductase [Azospirillum palustre]